jgi:hypothetical protein
VPAGDFPVSVVAGQSDKESFLQLDSSAIAAGSTVSSLVLTLHEDTTGGNVLADMAKIDARAVTGFFAAGDQGKPYANKPGYDTTGPGVAGKRAADGTWTFELAPIAARWASGELSNNGVALVPSAPVQGQSYEVVWIGVGKDKGPTVAGSFTPPAAAAAPAAASGGESAPVDTSPASIPISPDVSGGGLTTSASPTVAAPTGPTATPARPATNNRSARARLIGSTHRAPPWPFYLAVAAAIAVIGVSTLSLGDLGEPEPDRRGGVLRALERREEVPL